MSGLVIENLTKSFDGLMVLEDFSLEIASGQLLVVLGPSGCGKSTFLRLIAGLEQPDRGKIILDGRDVTALEPQKRRTAMVFQNYALYPHMTVFENLAFPLKVARLSKDEIRHTVTETARLMEMDQLLDRRPAQLSGGQRQRVALGRGLVRQPSIFLLDEPLSNLDAALRQRMRQEIVALQKKLNITMVYVTHDQVEALTMADKIVVLKDGHIHQCGSPAEIYDDPEDTFVASFLGSPAINLFDDDIKSGKSHFWGLDLGFQLPDGQYTLGIRPDHLKLNENGMLRGRIIALEYIGARSHLKIETGELAFTVIDESDGKNFEIGQQAGLDVDRRNILIFEKKTGRRLRPTG